MKKFKLIFFVVYGVFHVSLLGFTIYANNLYQSNSIADLLKLANAIPDSRWLATTGLGLFLVNLVLFLLVVRGNQSKVASMEKEKNEYKAKMFDMQSSKGGIPEVEAES